MKIKKMYLCKINNKVIKLIWSIFWYNPLKKNKNLKL